MASPHRIVLALGAVLVASHAVVVPADLRLYSHALVELLVLGAMVWAVRRFRPAGGQVWWMMTAGLGLLVVGGLVHNGITRTYGEEVYPSAADGLDLAGYAVLSWGMVAAPRARGRPDDGSGLLDAALVTVVAAAASWVYLVDLTVYEGVPLLERVVSAAHPVGDVLLLAFVVRFLVSSGRRSTADQILAAGIGLLLVADVAHARLALTGDYAAGGWLDVAYHLSYLCFPVAAAHPQTWRPAARRHAAVRAGRARLWFLAAVSLVLPSLAALELATGDPGEARTLAVASVAVFLLLTFRTGMLNTSLAAALHREQQALRGERDARERERVLRALGIDLVGSADRRAIASLAVEAARRLSGGDADAILLVGDASLTSIATTGGGDVTGPVQRGAFPEPLLAQLGAGRAVTVAPDETLAVRDLLPEAFRSRRLFVVPLVTGGRLSGMVLVAAPCRGCRPDRVVGALDSLGSAVSLALESSDLAERLVDERSEQRFGAIIRNSSDIFVVLRPDGTPRFVSPSLTRVLGWGLDEVSGLHVSELIHPDDVEHVAAALAASLGNPGTHATVECRVRHRDGSWRRVEAIGTSQVDDPFVGGIVVNVRDVTERVELEKALIHQALHDPLTGLANRVLLVDRMEHALQGAGRRGERVEVLLLDLDDFKTVNDSLGHPLGDAVLVAVAERLRTCVRSADTAARLGGDEFAVLLADGGDGCAAVAERIVDSLRRPVVADGRDVCVRVSVGVSCGAAGDDAADLLRQADLAMYVAKSEGKDRWVGFRPEMLERFLFEVELEQSVRAAVEEDQLLVHYQPLVDVATGEITGAEALVRWVDPARGYVPPAELIAVAERSDLIETIGRFVLREACAFAVRCDGGRGPRLSHVAVNMSARQLRAPDLVDDVRAVLEETGLAPHRLLVEITESMLLDHLQETVDRLDALRELGVRIAVDDFGTGYCSLSYLGRLPVDVLKVDRSFTEGLDRDDDRNLVPAILELARTLKLGTVAEGVESHGQLVRLGELGCQLAQGYYFSRPVPEADFRDLLDRPPPAAAGPRPRTRSAGGRVTVSSGR